MAASLKIGEVATRAGVGVETLRYYERRGLLAEPKRTSKGYRSYEPEAVRLVRFIKRAQELGFTLEEIKELIALRDGAGTCREAREAASVKLEDIKDKIESLRSMQRALEELVRTCSGGAKTTRQCPILEAMEDGDESALELSR